MTRLIHSSDAAQLPSGPISLHWQLPARPPDWRARPLADRLAL